MFIQNNEVIYHKIKSLMGKNYQYEAPVCFDYLSF